VPADVTADQYFAIVPEWVLDDTRTANAVKLYAILRRYADKASGEAHPSRRTLANRMRFSRPQTIDPIVEELVSIGAIIVHERWNEAGDRDSNGYTIISTPPNRVGAPPARGGVPETVQRVGAPPAHKPESPEPESVEPEKTLAHGGAAGLLGGLDVEETDPVLDSFERAWKAWPRSESRKAALVSYRRAARSLPVAALERFTIAWAEGASAVIASSTTPKEQKSRTPYLVSWLNGERWTEAPPVPDRDTNPARGEAQRRDLDRLAEQLDNGQAGIGYGTERREITS
jgi:hypothetical protein